ncbi:type I restriction enzyme S subunit [Arthrobacter sp. UYP6]|uniref:restriction endonuclease subunit S n=1 Tax=Arthrobacter sp. UYP6 TaxID=1756378 RepID=UPI0033991494
MTARQQLTFGELGTLFDGPHATPTRMETGPYFLNISSLNSGRLDLSLSDHVSEDDFARWTRRVTPREGDLLFSYETRLGEAALMPAGVEACLGRRMALLRPNPAIVDPRFLLYYYLSPGFQQLIEQHTIHGATVNRIGLSTMGTWPVSIPALDEQQAIAEVLGALDDKIAANTKLAEISMELSEAHFRQLLTDTTELGTLGELLTLEYGKALPASLRRQGPAVVYGSGGVVGSHDQALKSGPGIIVGRKGSAGVVHWSPDAFFPIDTTYYVEPKFGDESLTFCYHMLRSLKLSEMNSDSAVPGLNRNEAHATKVQRISRASIQSFGDLTRPLFAQAAQYDKENRTLAATRDTLLPQLMSGKLRVKDAEQTVGELI